MSLTRISNSNRIGSYSLDDRQPVFASDVNPIIDAVNELIDGTIDTTDLNLSGNLTVAGTTDLDSLDVIGNINAGGTVGVNALGVVGTTALAGKVTTGAGTVSNPAIVIGTNDNGFYEVSSTQQGFSIANALVGGFNASGLFTGNIAEQVATVGVTVDSTLLKDGLVITKATPVAINSTGAATAAQIVSGYITSTSAAATAITTPTATAIAALIGAVRGTSFDLVIDNSLGANTVTLTLDASIAVVTPAVTGGDTLTVSTANAIGIFRIVFTSGTTAKIFRIA
jgi:hypothetical protein